uniref:Uncharacterized protein n=1 Tax=Aureoumbra lagunensis TaxID=44058 RepID=A0A7S3JTQ0_9STRA|mmetsp:Transcript_2507/g.4010  ORF Transcript_2507/g.4010 Transcript_2507/m.4010 type:complete len:437 (+) Transcript_2507:33-1343(+)
MQKIVELLTRFSLNDVDAGIEILENYMQNEEMCTLFVQSNGLDICSRHILGEVVQRRSVALKILANIAKHSSRSLASSHEVAAAVASAFCFHATSIEVRLEALWILCKMVKYWANIFGSELLQRRLAKLLFDLTCSLNPHFSQVERNKTKEIFIGKLFEMVWRLADNENKAFLSLHAFSETRCILTAALEYALDPRARINQDVARHRLDGPISSAIPSGLDCALRVLYSIAQLDVKLYNDALSSRDNDRQIWFESRLNRISDCACHLETLIKDSLNADEAISIQLTLVQSVWPFHNFEAELFNNYTDFTMKEPSTSEKEIHHLGINYRNSYYRAAAASESGSLLSEKKTKIKPRTFRKPAARRSTSASNMTSKSATSSTRREADDGLILPSQLVIPPNLQHIVSNATMTPSSSDAAIPTDAGTSMIIDSDDEEDDL